VLDVFNGAEDLKIDPKGRVTIPSRFRRIIEAGDPNWEPGARPTLMMVFGVTRGEHAWQRLEFLTVRNHDDLIDRLLASDMPSAEFWRRVYNNYTLPVQLDERGV
jgi:MraZ protein